jgi:ribose transport system ATP-binding protein
VPNPVTTAVPPAEDFEASQNHPLLVATGISKRYAAVQAISDVDLSLDPGEIHALVGENGSGKSTLVGVVSGTVQPDSGSVIIAGTELTRSSPRSSQALGAVTVFQDGSLIAGLSVEKNLYLGTSQQDRPSYRKAGAWASSLLARYNLDIDPTMLAGHLPPGDRQLVEIVRAVSRRPKVLILDEATSALDARGVDIVLDLMRVVAGAGSAVLFVTHRLSEVMRVADSVTVLRDGNFQGTYPARGVNTHQLVELMAGAPVDMEFPDRTGSADSEAILSAHGLSGLGFGPVDAELRAGQIVGIAGADGNGQVPLLRSMARHGGDVSGEVAIRGRTITNYAQAVRSGVVYLSSNRMNESLFGDLTISDNLGIGVLDELSDAGVMRIGRERSFVSASIDRYRIRVGHPGQTPRELSGGNQQKVALSRVLAMKPKVVLVDEPTQGVDVRSRMDIYRFLRDIAESGSAAVVVSSDASELAGLCDRILVMSRGKVTQEISGIGATEEAIVAAFAVEHEPDPVDVAAVYLAEAVALGRRCPAGGSGRLHRPVVRVHPVEEPHVPDAAQHLQRDARRAAARRGGGRPVLRPDGRWHRCVCRRDYDAGHRGRLLLDAAWQPRRDRTAVLGRRAGRWALGWPGQRGPRRGNRAVIGHRDHRDSGHRLRSRAYAPADRGGTHLP